MTSITRLAVPMAALLALFVPGAGATVKYRVSVAQPEQHWFRVTMEIPEARSGMQVALPAWNALYQVRDFSQRVEDVRATASDGSGSAAPLRVTKIDKDTWTLTKDGAAAGGALGGDVEVTYRIFWDDAGPFNTQLNAHHAFVNFAEILMYLPDRRGEATEVAFENVAPGWKAIAELAQGSGANSFSAKSYDALVDAPVEMSVFEEAEFNENGAKFRVAMDGDAADKDTVVGALKRITAYETGMMGGAPFSEYTFFFHIGPYREAGGGGMEHANCTAIASSSANGAIQIAAHEFFHAWNVKRIRPASLEPVDYTKEQYTRALWFAEGVTSTYASYALLRSGLWSKGQFYSDLGAQIGELESRPARKWKSVEEASLDAWLEKYDFYGRPDVSISYYNKGQIDGEMLDLAIRDATDDRASLDDVMRRMNEEYAKKGKFYDDSAGVERVAEEVAGKNLKDFFAKYVAGTDEIPYGDFLALAGLQVKKSSVMMPILGFDIDAGPGGARVVAEVDEGGPAEVGGLQAGDTLEKINGEAFPVYISRWMQEHVKPGDTVRLEVLRDGAPKTLTMKAVGEEQENFEVSETAGASAKQVKIREGWLSGKTE